MSSTFHIIPNRGYKVGLLFIQNQSFPAYMCVKCLVLKNSRNSVQKTIVKLVLA